MRDTTAMSMKEVKEEPPCIWMTLFYFVGWELDGLQNKRLGILFSTSCLPEECPLIGGSAVMMLYENTQHQTSETLNQNKNFSLFIVTVVKI